MTYDQIYKAWRAVGADVAGLKWDDFAKKLAAPPAQQPVAWADLLKDAQQIVESKVLWKRFIDGTPLSNDIACWMADFAQQYTHPPQRKPLTDEQIKAIEDGIWKPEFFDDTERQANREFAHAIEAAHGIKGETK